MHILAGRREKPARLCLDLARPAFAAFFLLLLFAAYPCQTAHAAPSRSQAAKQRAEFASFVDGFLSGIQRDRHIPGMSFVAVQDGEVLYLKGYGVADIESKEPVSADATLFRIGSISEAFTAAAVMQLVEKERVALDEDANTYLRRWKLPGFSGPPVTLRHLLTHTAGFDDKQFEIYAPTPEDERNFGSRLQKIMPARYAQAGLYYSHSSMGYALLGSIVERYSRQPFHAAVEKYIFQPLGMRNSTFSLEGAQMAQLATGYDSGEKTPYTHRYDIPAMGMSSTARDMGRFMLAQLGEGALGRGRIMQPMYAGSMIRTHFAPHRAVDGSAIPYLERRVAGLRVLQLNGDIPGYSSFMMLVPEKKFGLFYAANVSGLKFDGDMASSIIRRFLADSADKPAPKPPQTAVVRPDVAGYYRLNRISRHTAEKITKLTAPQLKVAVSGEGITVADVREKNPPRPMWSKIDDPASERSGDLYAKIDSSGRLLQEDFLFFQRAEDGSVKTLIIQGVNHTYDKLKKSEWYSWQNVFTACFLTIVVLSAVGMVLGMAINKRNLPWEKGLRSATELWTISAIFCCIQLAFVAGLAISSIYLGEEFAVFVPYKVKALFVLPLAGGLLLAWFWFRIFGNLLNPDHHWAEKVLLIVMALGETGYMLFLANWRLLGFMF